MWIDKLGTLLFGSDNEKQVSTLKKESVCRRNICGLNHAKHLCIPRNLNTKLSVIKNVKYFLIEFFRVNVLFWKRRFVTSMKKNRHLINQLLVRRFIIL